MQNLRLFVPEGNTIEGYVGVRKDSSLGRPHKLRLIQKIPYLFTAESTMARLSVYCNA